MQSPEWPTRMASLELNTALPECQKPEDGVFAAAAVALLVKVVAVFWAGSINCQLMSQQAL